MASHEGAPKVSFNAEDESKKKKRRSPETPVFAPAAETKPDKNDTLGAVIGRALEAGAKQEKPAKRPKPTAEAEPTTEEPKDKKEETTTPVTTERATPAPEQQPTAQKEAHSESSSEVEEDEDDNEEEPAEEAPLEELSKEERRTTTEAILDEREAAVTEELAQMQPEDNAEPAQADETFLKFGKEHLQDGATSPEEALDLALQQAKQLHAAEVVETATTTDEQGAELLPELTELETPGIDGQNNAETPTDASRELPDTEDNTQAAAYATGGGGRAGVAGPPNATPGTPGFAGGYNAGPLPVTRGSEQPVNAFANTATDLLAGGIIGYLIGRRRGRIKAERRLKAVQNKLEAEVRAIQHDVLRKESEIRDLVRQRTEQANRAVQQLREATAGQPAKQPETVMPAEPTHRPASFQERIASAAEKAATIPLAAVEAGRNIVPGLAESARPMSGAETIYSREAEENHGSAGVRKPEAVPAADPEKAPLSEVLAVAGEIPVGATTLNRVFETNLISERGLRRVLAEYRRGGDFRQVLAQELLIHERDHELDPRLRDKPVEPSQDRPPMPVDGPLELNVPVGSPLQGAPAGQAQSSPSSPSEHFSPQSAAKTPAQVQTAVAAATITAFVVLGILLAVLVVIWLVH